MTDPSFESPEALDLLRRRVSQFGLWGFATGLFFLGFRVLMEARGEEYADFSANLGTWLAHCLGTAFFGLTWLLTRRSERSAGFVHAIEMVGIIGGCVAYAAMGLFMPSAWRPDWVVVLVLTHVMVIRAVIVPSSARRTFVVSLVFMVPVLGVAYFHAPAVGTVWAPVLEELYGVPMDIDRYAVAAVGWTGSWWVAAIGICTLTSHVIYGLRREVHKAMRLGQYTLEERIGQGGMGVVFKARHSLLQRPTALKLLPPEIAGERAIRRFEAEVQQTSRLTHPNTVSIYDYGRTMDGVFYYVMEYLDGVSLQELVELDGPQSPGRAIYLLSQAAHGLAEAHAAGLVHRDIKPANILLVNHGGVADLVKLVDFGLVREIDGDTQMSRTSTDALEGTPLYTPPEAVTSPTEVDGRSDLYSLGAVGYFLLCGAPPFDGRTSVEVFSMHLHEQPVPPSMRLGAALPEDLEGIIMSCLAKKPAERPDGAREFWHELRSCRDAESWNVHEAEKWWKLKRPAIEKAREEKRRQERRDADLPAPPTVAVPRRATKV